MKMKKLKAYYNREENERYKIGLSHYRPLPGFMVDGSIVTLENKDDTDRFENLFKVTVKMDNGEILNKVINLSSFNNNVKSFILSGETISISKKEFQILQRMNREYNDDLKPEFKWIDDCDFETEERFIMTVNKNSDYDGDDDDIISGTDNIPKCKHCNCYISTEEFESRMLCTRCYGDIVGNVPECGQDDENVHEETIHLKSEY